MSIERVTTMLERAIASKATRAEVLLQQGRSDLSEVASHPLMKESNIASVAQSLLNAAHDEADALGGTGKHAFLFRCLTQNGKEVGGRERLRIAAQRVDEDEAPRATVVKGGLATSRASTPASSDDDDQRTGAATGRMTVREEATVVGMLRQQMRHNEGLTGIVVASLGPMVEGWGKTINAMQAQNAHLLERVDKLFEHTIKNADHQLQIAQQTRLLEAQARKEDMQSEAIAQSMKIVGDLLPVAVMRIAKKYGLAPDDLQDRELEALVSSFDEDQLPALFQVLKPAQREAFANFYQQVAKKKLDREKQKEQAAGSTPANGNGKSGSSSDGPSSNKNGAAGSKPAAP